MSARDTRAAKLAEQKAKAAEEAQRGAWRAPVARARRPARPRYRRSTTKR
jgi:hypothetical protein